MRVGLRLRNETRHPLWYLTRGNLPFLWSGASLPQVAFDLLPASGVRWNPALREVRCIQPGTTLSVSLTLSSTGEHSGRLGLEVFGAEPTGDSPQVGAYVWSPEIPPETTPFP